MAGKGLKVRITETQEQVPDGRRQRSERSRQLIIDALVGLINEGILLPTAQQVSERAGVGIRSVFRHFSDMESLYAAVDSRLREQYQGLFAGGDRNGSLPERLQHAAAQRAIAYEATGKLFLSTRAQLWRYPSLQEQYARLQRQLRRDLDGWLPELQQLTAERRDMVDAVASFETWDRLRQHQNMSRKAATGLVAGLLHLIILEH